MYYWIILETRTKIIIIVTLLLLVIGSIFGYKVYRNPYLVKPEVKTYPKESPKTIKDYTELNNQ